MVRIIAPSSRIRGGGLLPQSVSPIAIAAGTPGEDRRDCFVGSRAPVSQGGPHGGHLTAPKILCVDDDRDILISMKESIGIFLGIPDESVLVADHMSTALDVFNERGNQIKAVVTDVEMGDREEGLALHKALREIYGFQGPIVITSGGIDLDRPDPRSEKVREMLAQYSNTRFYPKPFSISEILTWIKEAWEARHETVEIAAFYQQIVSLIQGIDSKSLDENRGPRPRWQRFRTPTLECLRDGARKFQFRWEDLSDEQEAVRFADQTNNRMPSLLGFISEVKREGKGQVGEEILRHVLTDYEEIEMTDLTSAFIFLEDILTAWAEEYRIKSGSPFVKKYWEVVSKLLKERLSEIMTMAPIFRKIIQTEAPGR